MLPTSAQTGRVLGRPRPGTLLVPLLGGAALLGAALYNGYPLTFWDTRAYLANAVTLEPRPDRLIGYSLLIRALSVGHSLWPVAAAQCAIVAWLVLRTCRTLRPRVSAAHYGALMAALGLGTALPWVAGQLMADVFTPVLVLSIWLLLEDDSLTRWQRTTLLVLLAISAGVHLTHVPIGLGLLGMGWLLGRWLRRDAGQQVIAAALALAVGLGGIATWNASRTGRLTLASGSDAFLLGHMVESGLAGRVLNEHCPKRGYLLCPYRARLPLSVDELLWVDALDIEPWRHEATISREARWELIDSLREHPLLHLRVALLYTLGVLGRFRTGEGLDSDAEPVIEPQIAKIAPGDLPAYGRAKQQADAIPVASLRAVHTPIGALLITLSLLVLLRAVRAGREAFGYPSVRLLFMCCGAWLLTGVISGNLSGVYDRYEARLIWMFGVGLWGLGPAALRALSSRWSKRGAEAPHTTVTATAA